jgi:hypothetical protein
MLQRHSLSAVFTSIWRTSRRSAATQHTVPVKGIVTAWNLTHGELRLDQASRDLVPGSPATVVFDTTHVGFGVLRLRHGHSVTSTMDTASHGLAPLTFDVAEKIAYVAARARGRICRWHPDVGGAVAVDGVGDVLVSRRNVHYRDVAVMREGTCVVCDVAKSTYKQGALEAVNVAFLGREMPLAIAVPCVLTTSNGESGILRPVGPIAAQRFVPSRFAPDPMQATLPVFRLRLEQKASVGAVYDCSVGVLTYDGDLKHISEFDAPPDETAVPLDPDALAGDDEAVDEATTLPSRPSMPTAHATLRAYNLVQARDGQLPIRDVRAVVAEAAAAGRPGVLRLLDRTVGSRGFVNAPFALGNVVALGTGPQLDSKTEPRVPPFISVGSEVMCDVIYGDPYDAVHQVMEGEAAMDLAGSLPPVAIAVRPIDGSRDPAIVETGLRGKILTIHRGRGIIEMASTSALWADMTKVCFTTGSFAHKGSAARARVGDVVTFSINVDVDKRSLLAWEIKPVNDREVSAGAAPQQRDALAFVKRLVPPTGEVTVTTADGGEAAALFHLDAFEDRAMRLREGSPLLVDLSTRPVDGRLVVQRARAVRVESDIPGKIVGVDNGPFVVVTHERVPRTFRFVRGCAPAAVDRARLQVGVSVVFSLALGSRQWSKAEKISALIALRRRVQSAGGVGGGGSDDGVEATTSSGGVSLLSVVVDDLQTGSTADLRGGELHSGTASARAPSKAPPTLMVLDVRVVDAPPQGAAEGSASRWVPASATLTAGSNVQDGSTIGGFVTAHDNLSHEELAALLETARKGLPAKRNGAPTAVDASFLALLAPVDWRHCLRREERRGRATQNRMKGTR